MQVTLSQIRVPLGQQLCLENISWQEFERILEELGDKRASRVSYSGGVLEIMVPLPEHEKDKEGIGDLVKRLLEALDIDFEALGSTTLKNAQMQQAVEHDTCFYIENYRAVIGKKRLDLAIDPPPDLAIEIDITSRTRLENYQRLGVRELWRYTRSGLEINLLEKGNYNASTFSPHFPNIPIIDLVNQTVQRSQEVGRSQAVREFKEWIKQNLGA
jgi:hypothetical protein